MGIPATGDPYTRGFADFTRDILSGLLGGAPRVERITFAAEANVDSTGANLTPTAVSVVVRSTGPAGNDLVGWTTGDGWSIKAGVYLARFTAIVNGDNENFGDSRYAPDLIVSGGADATARASAFGRLGYNYIRTGEQVTVTYIGLLIVPADTTTAHAFMFNDTAPVRDDNTIDLAAGATLDLASLANVRGDKGDKGDPGGVVIHTESRDPTPSDGSDDDFWINVRADEGAEILEKIEGVWLRLTNATKVGANPAGTDGAALTRIAIAGTNYNLPSGASVSFLIPADPSNRWSNDDTSVGNLAWIRRTDIDTALSAVSSPSAGDLAVAIHGVMLNSPVRVYTWVHDGTRWIEISQNAGPNTNASLSATIFYGSASTDEEGAGIIYAGQRDSIGAPRTINIGLSNRATGPGWVEVANLDDIADAVEGDYLLVDLALTAGDHITETALELRATASSSGIGTWEVAGEPVADGNRLRAQIRLTEDPPTTLLLGVLFRKLAGTPGSADNLVGTVHRVTLLPQASLGAALAARIAGDYLAETVADAVAVWVSGAGYEAGAVVIYHSQLWVCSVAHSGITTVPSADGARWLPVFAQIPEWSVGSFYRGDTLVEANSQLWTCRVANIADQDNAPPNSTYWRPASSSIIVPPWRDTVWPAGSMVMTGAGSGSPVVWVTPEGASGSDGPNANSDWVPVSSHRGTWSAGYFSPGQTVFHGGNLFICVAAVTPAMAAEPGSDDANADHWQQLTPPDAPIAIPPAADDATGALGVSSAFAREDHKHPKQDVDWDEVDDKPDNLDEVPDAIVIQRSGVNVQWLLRSGGVSVDVETLGGATETQAGVFTVAQREQLLAALPQPEAWREDRAWPFARLATRPDGSVWLTRQEVPINTAWDPSLWWRVDSEETNVNRWATGGRTIFDGEWRDGRQYYSGEAVTFRGHLFTATSDHTSDSTNAPNVSTSPWHSQMEIRVEPSHQGLVLGALTSPSSTEDLQTLATKGWMFDRGAYATNETYYPQNVVTHAGAAWVCLTLKPAGTANPPAAGSSYWRALVPASSTPSGPTRTVHNITLPVPASAPGDTVVAFNQSGRYAFRTGLAPSAVPVGSYIAIENPWRYTQPFIARHRVNYQPTLVIPDSDLQWNRNDQGGTIFWTYNGWAAQESHLDGSVQYYMEPVFNTLSAGDTAIRQTYWATAIDDDGNIVLIVQPDEVGPDGNQALQTEFRFVVEQWPT